MAARNYMLRVSKNFNEKYKQNKQKLNGKIKGKGNSVNLLLEEYMEQGLSLMEKSEKSGDIMDEIKRKAKKRMFLGI